MHRNAWGAFKRHALDFFTPTTRVLEIGPDLDSPIHAPHAVWHTADISRNPKLTYWAGEYSLPISTPSYDVVFSTSVLEHVRKPWLWMRELVRVCRPGGVVITITPLNWPYHEDPIDCWRAYPAGLAALHEEAGLETLVAALYRSSSKSPGEKLWFPWFMPVIDTIGIGRKPC